MADNIKQFQHSKPSGEEPGGYFGVRENFRLTPAEQPRTTLRLLERLRPEMLEQQWAGSWQAQGTPPFLFILAWEARQPNAVWPVFTVDAAIRTHPGRGAKNRLRPI
jgi:hypothetical protein